MSIIKEFIANKFTSYFRNEFDKTKLLQAKTLVWEIRNNKGKYNSIQDAEFSVFSQWGDDGIIQYLIHTLNITNKTFIEFGVENYTESNTRFLLMNDNWKGLVIDGSEKNIQYIKNDSISWKHDLTAIHSFITKDNINNLIKDAGFSGDIGLLHIDVDGNDYWFWNCLTVVNPIIVVMEYNSAFGADEAITIPYQEDFIASKAHYSGVYFGSSLKALNNLANEKGYSLVGCNSNGNNAYFIRHDKLKDLIPLDIKSAFVRATFRQNRDINGNLTLVNDHTVLKESCKHLPIYNTETKKTITISQALS